MTSLYQHPGFNRGFDKSSAGDICRFFTGQNSQASLSGASVHWSGPGLRPTVEKAFSRFTSRQYNPNLIDPKMHLYRGGEMSVVHAGSNATGGEAFR